MFIFFLLRAKSAKWNNVHIPSSGGHDNTLLSSFPTVFDQPVKMSRMLIGAANKENRPTAPIAIQFIPGRHAGLTLLNDVNNFTY